MDIDLRLLRSFAAIYEEGSLSRAAERLNCTQAAMSMRLKLIETEIGEVLFHRRHHRLEPASRAAEFYARAVAVLAAYDEMIDVMRSQKPRQRLRLGVPDDYALGILPRALEKLATGLGFDLEILCDLSCNLLAAVQHRRVDAALVTLAERPEAIAFEARLPLNWAIRPGALPPLTAPVPLAVYPEGCVFRKAMVHALDQSGRKWTVQTQSSTHAGIMAAVKAGIAITAMARGTAPPGVVEHEIAEGLPKLPDAPVYLIGQPPAQLKHLIAEELGAT